jgi:hypothetical protein
MVPKRVNEVADEGILQANILKLLAFTDANLEQLSRTNFPTEVTDEGSSIAVK